MNEPIGPILTGHKAQRGFAALQALCRAWPTDPCQTFAEVKAPFRDQYLLLRLDEERAVRAIPKSLPDGEQQQRDTGAAVRDVIAARGDVLEEGRRRLDRLRHVFGVTEQQAEAE